MNSIYMVNLSEIHIKQLQNSTKIAKKRNFLQFLLKTT